MLLCRGPWKTPVVSEKGAQAAFELSTAAIFHGAGACLKEKHMYPCRL
ncbi:MAG: hypothetical protein NC313_01370 [Butyrivibrio sp.]|nr:hypothetical protein [Butyrivibrio sp.]